MRDKILALKEIIDTVKAIVDLTVWFLETPGEGEKKKAWALEAYGKAVTWIKGWERYQKAVGQAGILKEIMDFLLDILGPYLIERSVLGFLKRLGLEEKA